MGKTFVVWVLFLAVLSGSYGLFTNHVSSSNPRKVVIAVDTSIGMKKFEGVIADRIKSIARMPFSEFSLITDKDKLVSDSAEAAFSPELKYYGSLQLEDLIDTKKYPELVHSDLTYIIIEGGKKSEVLKKVPNAKVIELH